MRCAILVAAICLAIGCSSPTVIVIPGTRGASTAPPQGRLPQCRYSRVVISHAASGQLSSNDLELNARVSALMGNELRRRGASVMDEPSEAYWSIMVLAADDSRFRDGFVFSATVSLRGFQESHDPGVTALEPQDDANARAVLYTALGFGPGYELASTVARFVSNADAALLPVARALCEQEGREIIRDVEAELAVPRPIPL
jgi:hypothetical protein